MGWAEMGAMFFLSLFLVLGLAERKVGYVFLSLSLVMDGGQQWEGMVILFF
jgi:hypothetical protein